ncbi:MAG: response regulator [Spirochaetes bacterium]|nr:response regulator [Spirochaetota bacterium]
MKLTGKILVVDDDTSSLEFFDIMLTNLGFETIKASDGLMALDKIRIHKPDLILLDNMMPKMNGFEVTQIIKKENDFRKFRNTPIIMFSALDSAEDKVLGLEMGVDDYITKPFNFSEVLARIRNVIRHKELTNQFLKRERRLAILESLNTNLIAFTRHAKQPLNDLHDEFKNIDPANSEQIQHLKDKYETYYKEVKALLEGIEDEILEIEKKGSKLKEEELSLEELEKRISKHLDVLPENVVEK